MHFKKNWRPTARGNANGILCLLCARRDSEVSGILLLVLEEAINPAPPSSVRAVHRAFGRGVTLQSAAEANAPLAGSCLIHNRLANAVSLASLKLIGGNSATSKQI
jgi:hypothetical protein